VSHINIRGRLIEVPRWTTADRRVGDFVEYLVRRGEPRMDRRRARQLADDVIAGRLVEVGENFMGHQVQPHLDGILRVRVELAKRYQAVLDHFGGRSGSVPIELPPELQPAAFRALFKELNQHLLGFEKAKTLTTELLDEPSILTDLEGLRDPAPDLPRGEAPSRAEPSGRRRGEADEVQLARARHLTRELGRQRRPPEVTEALVRFRAEYLPDLPEGWQVGTRRVTRTEAGSAQIAGLSELDPAFAANGYELMITPPGGVPGRDSFYPDGVAQFPRGGRFAFLEWKEPFGVEPSGYYATLGGQIELFQTMVQRARVAAEIPGCAGWMYDAGQPWLNDVLTDMVLVMREGFGSPAAERLGFLTRVLRDRRDLPSEFELRELSRYLHPPRPEGG
jgi:hypothetical protein